MAAKGIGAALLLVVILGGAYWAFTQGWLNLPSATIVAPQKTAIQCQSNTTPELKFVVLDAINQGTSRTNDFNVVIYLNGAYNNEYKLSSDSTADAAPGDGYAVYAHGTTEDKTYFGDIKTGNVGCDELQTTNFYVPQIGTMTFRAYNEDDGLANGAGDKQAVGSGESVSMEFEIKESTADKCLGTANSDKDLKLCVDYNTLAFLTPSVKKSGATLTQSSVPGGHSTIRNSFGGGTAGIEQDDTVCFTLDGVKEICDYATVDGLTLELQAKSSYNPGGTAGADDVNICVYMPQVFKNSETGVWDWYYSNEVDANAIVYPRCATIWVE